MELKQVKAVVNKLPLSNILKEGLAFSEPIMSKEGDKIIDNYFVYAIDYTENQYSGPIATFGVFSDTEEIAYINTDLSNLFKSECNKVFSLNPAPEGIREVFDLYEKTYSLVRDFLFNEEIADQQKTDLRNYINSMKQAVFEDLWKYYTEFVPPFFEWSAHILNE